jgi:hypothetical protein
MRVEASAFGHDYTTEGWGLVLALAAVLIAFVALSLAVLLPSRERRGAGLGWWATLGFAFGVVALAMPLWTWLNTADPFFGGGEPRSYHVFRSLLERQIGASVFASLLASVAALVAFSRKVRESFLLGVTVLLSGLVVLIATRESVELIRVDCLPRIERLGLPYLHVGRERALEVALTCGIAEVPSPVRYTAEHPGEHAIPFAAAADRFTVSRAVRYEAGEERGSSRFALKEGRRYVYHRHRKERIAGALSEAKNLDRHDEVVIDVLEPRVLDSLRLFPVRVQFGDEEPEELELAGWDGSLVYLDDERLVPFLGDPPLDEKFEGFFLPGVCEGIPESGPPAPTRCRKAVSTAAGMGATMMRIFTLGTASYLPERTVFTLERVHEREPDGPELAHADARASGPDERQDPREVDPS